MRQIPFFTPEAVTVLSTCWVMSTASILSLVERDISVKYASVFFASMNGHMGSIFEAIKEVYLNGLFVEGGYTHC